MQVGSGQFAMEISLIILGALVTFLVGYIAVRIRKINKLSVTVFGLKTVEGMQGLVDIVSQHEEDISELQENQEDMMEKQGDIVSEQEIMMKDIENIDETISRLKEEQNERVVSRDKRINGKHGKWRDNEDSNGEK